MSTNTSTAPFDPSSISRPDPALLTYYVLVAALTLVGFPFVFLPLYFKYHTLKFQFDDKGVSMSWGILFRREIYLTYRRIQDIHVTRNLFHRWLGLAAVAVQTASGSAGAEMTIEGIREPERLRDYLYSKMRGARGGETGEDGAPAAAEGDDEVLTLLHEIRDELRGLAQGAGRRVMSGATERSAEWVYGNLWSWLVRWFRVPDHPPTLPTAGGPADTFRPAREFLRYLKLLFWIVAIIIDITILVGFIVLTVALAHEGLLWVAVLIAPIALALAIVPDIIAYVAIHLRFDTTYYVMSDRSLRIRRGVWIIQETTLTFENVQNLRISKGPIQQLFGIANLVVETAGSGGDAGQKKGLAAANQGVVEGVADAEALRDRILHLRRSGDAGLGDEDEGAGWSPAHVAALRDVREAVRGLR